MKFLWLSRRVLLETLAWREHNRSSGAQSCTKNAASMRLPHCWNGCAGVGEVGNFRRSSLYFGMYSHSGGGGVIRTLVARCRLKILRGLAVNIRAQPKSVVDLRATKVVSKAVRLDGWRLIRGSHALWLGCKCFWKDVRGAWYRFELEKGEEQERKKRQGSLHLGKGQPERRSNTKRPVAFRGGIWTRGGCCRQSLAAENRKQRRWERMLTKKQGTRHRAEGRGQRAKED